VETTSELHIAIQYGTSIVKQCSFFIF